MSFKTVKILHTIIWSIMALGVIYIFYCGVTGEMGPPLYIALGMLASEIVVLLAFGWACPLTIVAKKIKPDWKDGDDIYLPKWLAINNKWIFGILLLLGIILIVIRLLTKPL